MAYGGGRGGSRGGGRQEYDNNMQGVLFDNERHNKDGDPNMRGQCEIEGVEYWISAWWNNSSKMGDYLKFRLEPKDERSNQRNDQRPQGNRPGNSRGPGARVNPGRRGPNSDQRDDRGGRHPNAPGNDNGFDNPDDDIPY